MHPIIDAHVHVSEKTPSHDAMDQASGDSRAVDAPAERLLECMDAAGVDRAVLVAMSGGRSKIAYVGACVQRYPGRFAGLSVLDAAWDDPAANYSRDTDEFGLQGIRVKDLEPMASSGRLDPLLDVLEAKGHAFWAFVPENQFPALETIVKRRPHLKTVINLLGMPSSPASTVVHDGYGRPTRPHVSVPPRTHEITLRMSSSANVFVQFGGQYQFSHEPHPHLDVRPMTQEIFDAYGAERMLWMTDWPWIERSPGYTECLKLVDQHLPKISTAERSMIMGGTCSRLLSFGTSI